MDQIHDREKNMKEFFTGLPQVLRTPQLLGIVVLLLTDLSWGADRKVAISAMYEVPVEDSSLKPMANLLMEEAYIVRKPDGDEITYTLPLELTGVPIPATFKEDKSVTGLKYFKGPAGAISCADRWKEIKCIIKCDESIKFDQKAVHAYLEKQYEGRELALRKQVADLFAGEAIGIIKATPQQEKNDLTSATTIDIDQMVMGSFSANSVGLEHWYKVNARGVFNIDLVFSKKGSNSTGVSPDLDLMVISGNGDKMTSSTSTAFRRENIWGMPLLNSDVFYIVVQNPVSEAGSRYRLKVSRKQ